MNKKNLLKAIKKILFENDEIIYSPENHDNDQPNENTIYGFCVISGKPFHKGHDNLIMSALNKLRNISGGNPFKLYVYVSNKSRAEKDQFPVLGISMNKIYKDIIKPHYDKIQHLSFNISGNPVISIHKKMSSILNTLFEDINKSDFILPEEKIERFDNVLNNIKYFYGVERTEYQNANQIHEDLEKMTSVLSRIKVKVEPESIYKNHDNIVIDKNGVSHIHWDMHKNATAVERSQTGNVSGTAVRRILSQLQKLNNHLNKALESGNNKKIDKLKYDIQSKQEEVFDLLPNFISKEIQFMFDINSIHNKDLDNNVGLAINNHFENIEGVTNKERSELIKSEIVDTIIDDSSLIQGKEDEYNKFIDLGGEKEENEYLKDAYFDLLRGRSHSEFQNTSQVINKLKEIEKAIKAAKKAAKSTS
jgi:hypothetical protein